MNSLNFIKGDKFDSIRGSMTKPTKNERIFWNTYSELLLDDMEVPWNDLITKLRSIAIDYWKRRR